MEAKGFAYFLFIVLLSLSSVCKLGLADGANKTWCVAKPSTDDNALLQNIDFACKDGNVDCKIIQPNGACYNPTTNISLASVAMNLYYQAYGRNLHNCDFKGSGLITITDPSYVYNKVECTYTYK